MPHEVSQALPQTDAKKYENIWSFAIFKVMIN